MAKIYKKLILVICVASTLIGCTTTTKFQLPKGAQLRLNDRPETFKTGDASMMAFFWDSMQGINYDLIKNDKVIKRGKLPAEIRIVSLFTTFPFFPVGFKYTCYDLTKGDVKNCNRI